MNYQVYKRSALEIGVRLFLMTTNQLFKKVDTRRLVLHAGTLPKSPILRVVAFAAIISFQGCGDRDELPEITKQAIQIDEIPREVRDAAKKAIPRVKFNEA